MNNALASGDSGPQSVHNNKTHTRLATPKVRLSILTTILCVSCFKLFFPSVHSSRPLLYDMHCSSIVRLQMLEDRTSIWTIDVACAESDKRSQVRTHTCFFGFVIRDFMHSVGKCLVIFRDVWRLEPCELPMTPSSSSEVAEPWHKEESADDHRACVNSQRRQGGKRRQLACRLSEEQVDRSNS